MHRLLVASVICAALLWAVTLTSATPALPFGWQVVRSSQPDLLTTYLPLLLPVKQQGIHLLRAMLLERSDPHSPLYGQYLSFDELGEIIRPLDSDIEAVEKWLSQVGAEEIEWNPHKEFVKCKVGLWALSKEAQWAYVQHPARGNRQPLVRSLDRLSMPQLLQGHIDFFHGVNAADLLPVTPRMLADYRKMHRGHSQQRASSSPSPSSSSSSSSYVNAHTVLQLLDANSMDSYVEVTAQLPTTVVPSVANVVFQLTQPWYSSGQQTVLNLTVAAAKQMTAQFLNVGNIINSTLSAQVIFKNGTKEAPVYFLGNLYPGPLITPNVAKRLYSIPDHEFGSSVGGTNAMSVAEFDEQYYSPNDLDSFLSLVGYTPANGINATVTVAGNGGNIPRLPGGESTLDVDWTLAIAPNVPLVFWSVGHGGWLLEWVQQLAAAANPPWVHSISYGVPESDETADYTDRVDQEIQKLGVRGLTIISTSGDIGVDDGDSCDPDTPDYPSSSAWTTSLGATALVRNTDMPVCSQYRCDQMEEVPCAADLGSEFTTGGGFSFRYNSQPYQTAAVKQYLATAPDLPPTTFFNPNGRGYNDIATLGFRMMVVQNMKPGSSGGTSASGPLAAGIFALLNSARLSRGMGPMGFANPWLYNLALTQPDAFHAVAPATNKCEEVGNFGELECCQYGFSSTPSWNPLGGLGTPYYPIWKEAALSTY